ncbi:MAG: hypothetical protein Hens3KO_03360 [Henriciella sp.]
MSTTDSASSALDPQRPWIDDERQLPSKMHWMKAMFDPTGASPKLHFTRVWTLCFFLQLMVVVLPVFIGFVLGLAGGDSSALTSFGVYASPIIFIATTIVSFIAHSRRLNDAEKSAAWAAIVLIPLVIGLFLCASAVMKKSAEYDDLYEARAEFLQAPEAWRAERIEERKRRQERNIALSELNTDIRAVFSGVFYDKLDFGGISDSEWQSGRLESFKEIKQRSEKLVDNDAHYGAPSRSRGQEEFPANQPTPSQVDYILRPSIGVIQSVLIVMNCFIMIWSLIWVARLPSRREAKV